MSKNQKWVYVKRKRTGGGPNWGAGWDDLIKKYWDDLEQIEEDNLHYKHNIRLINKTVKNLIKVFKKDIYSRNLGSNLTEKVNQIRGYLESAKSASEKVIALNMAEQFLRSIK